MTLFSSFRYGHHIVDDATEAIKSKIEVVKTSMQENIQQLLLNEEKLGRIESATVQLGEQSLAFRNSSKAVADRMWWQMWKTRLVIIGVVVCVLLIIIVPIAVTSK
jgi:vesicle-associated membrane protein 7